MLMNSTLIQNCTPEELSESLRQIVREELAGLRPETAPKYLTRKEVCELLKISLPTLFHYTTQGVITGSRVGTRILYDEASVREAVKQIPSLKYQRATPAIKKALR
jgi:excisionase family DNA binding protein